MSVYEWRDPWEAVEQVERFERDWYDREDEHRLEMRAVSMACADATYQIRRQAEAMMEPMMREAPLRNNHPPIFVKASDFR